MVQASQAYVDAEATMGVVPVSERGRTNQNPADIGFWALVVEDYRTHGGKFFEQGFWAIFVHRFGNWRMGQPKVIRAPSTVLYNVMFKLVEWICGISLWYTVKLGRRVRIWHHSGMSLGARAIGDDCHIRQNTTLGVAQTGVNDALPIIGARADIGAGAVIGGAVYIGEGAKIGANALVLSDVPDGATAMGNPSQIISMPKAVLPAEPNSKPIPESEDAATSAVSAHDLGPEPTLAVPRDLGKIALLGSANLDYLAMSLEATGNRFGLSIETHVPPFGQSRMELLQEDSALRNSDVTATLIVERAEDVLGDIYTAPLSLAPDDIDNYLDDALEPMEQLLKAARESLAGPVFVTRLAGVTRSSLMQADRGFDRGLAALLERANARLSTLAADLQDVHLLETEDMIAEVGRSVAEPGSFWHLGRVPYSEALNTHMARRILGGLLALKGATARLLILDLDNTLWGGVLGEDGIEGLDIGGAYPGSAYRAFQEAIIALSQRGVALALASKNDEDLALEMIETHPEMAIRPDSIVSHRIGWTEKSIGIQEMLEELSLGAANAMFIDDNPVEREKARVNVPGLIIPPFPDAPEELASWLLENPFLETLELTASDLKRTAQYKTRAKVTAAKRDFTNIEEFYRDLDMSLVFEPYGPKNQKRVLQLFVKTNQFNATGRRHNAGDVDAILARGGKVFAIGVADKHSGYELMGVLVVQPFAAMTEAYPNDPVLQSVGQEGDLWVDNFLMSCRILGRTIEDAIVAWLTERANDMGFERVVGQVNELPRNTPVRGVFEKAGMARIPDGPDLGAGGMFQRDLQQDGPLRLPDYFTIRDEAPNDHPARIQEPRRPKKVNRRPTPPATDLLPLRTPLDLQPTVTLDPDREAKLAQVFRVTFGLGSQDNVAKASMQTLPVWDSLGHLRLAMQVEKDMGVKISGDKLSLVTTYSDLRLAVARSL